MIGEGFGFAGGFLGRRSYWAYLQERHCSMARCGTEDFGESGDVHGE
jgi:hypothetical protein